ncbi:SMI1/KNR4 family protein, partial [Streptomyces sp. NPDC026589]
GLMPLEQCSLLVMNPREEPLAPRGFDDAEPGCHGRDLFLHVIEMGCTDVCVIAVTGPLTGRVLIGNSDGFWGPNVSSATDFLDWYERWLNHMSAGRDNRALELTSPQLRAHPARHRPAPNI